MLLPDAVVNPRRLAAIDIVYLGWKFVITEFAIAVTLCPALGAFVLLRRQSGFQLGLGLYLIALGINYLPMLLYAVAIAKQRSARVELGEELNDKRRAMAKYRRQSIALLIPLLVPAMVVWQERRRARVDGD
jgi:hypothetical protein